MHADTEDMGGRTLFSSQMGKIQTLICMEGVNKRFVVPEQETFQVEED
jgi:hypothetical protein